MASTYPPLFQHLKSLTELKDAEEAAPQGAERIAGREAGVATTLNPVLKQSRSGDCWVPSFAIRDPSPTGQKARESVVPWPPTFRPKWLIPWARLGFAHRRE